MPISFRMGKYIGPSGIALAVIDIPPLSPEDNISLVDNAYLWEENVSSMDVPVVMSNVDASGWLSPTTSVDFVITNITTPESNDIQPTPLYYKHECRFYNYSYGENPSTHVYITDTDGNILKGINYYVKAQKVTDFVYKLDILTDFVSDASFTYMVKYNRCKSDGTEIYPSWVEIVNAAPLFTMGSPSMDVYQYTVISQAGTGLYYPVVPPVPKLSSLKNAIGVSFENAPTLVENSLAVSATYNSAIPITITLKATSDTTFSIKRDCDRTGTIVNNYLTSATTDSWGAGTNFSTGTVITGIAGVVLEVNADNPLIPNDEMTFILSAPKYYLKSTSYEAIYLTKPTNVTVNDDWYIKVKAGSFRRRMDTLGNPTPSGVGTMYEYSLPEYDRNVWDFTYGEPYKYSSNERPSLIDSQTVQLKNTPLFIDPSSVIGNPTYPGFPSSGYLFIEINDTALTPDNILDWNANTGEVKLGRTISNKDNILASYLYEEDFYSYPGFAASGSPYPDVPPFPYFELNLNPTPGRGYDMYAEGSVASVFLRPRRNADMVEVINSECLYHNFTGVPSGVYDFNLGYLSLGPSCKVSDVQVIDTRIRGGGLNKRGIEELDKVIEVQPEAQFFWDVGYFDGQAVPANGAIVVEIPKEVLKSNGGTLEESDVKAKVYKHIALGEYAIIQYV